MRRTVLTPIRLPTELIDKAEEMLPRVAPDPEVAAVGRVTRTSVLRMALANGLKTMEWKYGPKSEPPKRRRT